MRNGSPNRRGKLLVLSYGFPPAGGGGLKRLIKFLKYLPEEGWDCVVLTSRNGNFSIYDQTLLKEIDPGLPVHRAYTFESLFKKGIGEIPTGVGSIAPGEEKGEAKSLVSTVVGRAYKAAGSCFKIPDSRILWMPGALLAGRRILREHDIDAIYASGPTFSNFPVAVLLKKMSGKPVILDFRDAWMADPMLLEGRKEFVLRANRRLERYVVRNADRVVSTNPFVTRDFQDRYPSDDPGKYDTIYNGFDVEDHVAREEKSPLEPGFFHVVYTGRLYGERTPRCFLQALRGAMLERPSLRESVRVTFVGACERFHDGKRIGDYLEECGLKDVVRLTGHVSRKESLRYEMGADLLLVLIGMVPPGMGMTYGISGKIFDYMVSGKPILTLANEGASREFVVSNRVGSIYRHEDLEGIKNFLFQAHDAPKDAGSGEAAALRDYRRFDIREAVAQLASHLDSIAPCRGE